MIRVAWSDGKTERERESASKKIDALESQIAVLHDSMADPDYFHSGGERIAADAAKLKELEENLATAYARWEELDAI